ncbi:MAG: tetratricopeptide repeat protein [Nitrospinae bacterium]|nr:tetratricopeptide repeat protein [Nitrospinota bacterium]
MNTLWTALELTGRAIAVVPGRVLPDAQEFAFKTGWEVVIAVMTRHVPVLIGVVSFFIVLMIPYVYGYYVKYIKKPDLAPAVPEESEPHPWFSKPGEGAGELAGDMEMLKPLEQAAANVAGGVKPSPEAVNHLEEQAGKLSTAGAKATAFRLLGDIHRGSGDLEKAEAFYLEGSKVGAKTKKEAAFSAYGISLIHESRGDIGQALDHSRRALVLFDQSGMKEETLKITERIKSLKSRD